MRIAVVGCTHGELNTIYAKIEQINATEEPIQLLLCCGDFESIRNDVDLMCVETPPKYLKYGDFIDYYTGAKVPPVLTIFIGGNHEASNYLQDLYYGGYVAPNIFYLGSAGVVQVNGLRIAGFSGIYDERDYKFGQHEKFPYSKKTRRSIYHTREFQAFQLGHLKEHIDIVMSHDWPRGITTFGDATHVYRSIPTLEAQVVAGTFGSVAGERVLHTLQPAHWFAGHMHVKFAADVAHDTGKTTKFLALDKCPHRDFMDVVDIPAPQESNTVKLQMDLEWLAVLRATHHLSSAQRIRPPLPETPLPISPADMSWIESRLPSGQQTDWITSFQFLPSASIGNPQTDELLALLDLPHVVTVPFQSK
ncbi:unnamed protein product [Aphanomyces euteiches]|uniref:Lariat debranching enzyme C-terminal domain-containing protein n=1 Tax=Aphanomyces euteiches TaxID=100861 RepID=A0A6G0XRX8_9STRA|nr:hypothetical protein Ae201684_002167 [Aphanomyces euteiches]KAH9087146.1 hypothetical protein Ae201684P_000558 [Aphanomyces euteiches]KAH9132394.1 hypothetical protein AeRB84_021152 [Aphanomyces euteiches]